MKQFTILLLVFAIAGCSVKIKDETFCAPIPGHLGAACDNFLSSNQVILDETGWEALQAQWNAAGFAVECTSSQTVGDIKGEIEKLCSVAKCTREVKTALKQLVQKMLAVAKISNQMGAPIP